MRKLEHIGKQPAFLFSVASADDLQDVADGEFAIFGASNVGKSSLINALGNQKSLAKTSKTPGQTQLINFFSFPPNVFLADLPGYGFANVPIKIRKDWDVLLLGYLKSRANKLNAYLLVDSRRNFRETDMETMKLLQHHNIKYKIVFTKIDKLNKTEQTALKEKIFSEFNTEAFITSAKDRIGIFELKQDMGIV
jgi:GTP-binding protein